MMLNSSTKCRELRESFASPSFLLPSALFMCSLTGLHGLILLPSEVWTSLLGLCPPLAQSKVIVHYISLYIYYFFNVLCLSRSIFLINELFPMEDEKQKSPFSFWKGDPITLTVADGSLLRKPDKANASINVQNVRSRHQIEKVQVNTHSSCFSETRTFAGPVKKQIYCFFLPLSNTLKFLSRAGNTEVPWSHQGNNSAQLIWSVKTFTQQQQQCSKSRGILYKSPAWTISWAGSVRNPKKPQTPLICGVEKSQDQGQAVNPSVSSGVWTGSMKHLQVPNPSPQIRLFLNNSGAPGRWFRAQPKSFQTKAGTGAAAI